MPEEENVVKEAIKDSKDILRLSLVTIILTFKDVNGTHVMQKIIFAIKEENRSAINEILLENIERLVLDSNGVCVVIINNNK